MKLLVLSMLIALTAATSLRVLPVLQTQQCCECHDDEESTSTIIKIIQYVVDEPDVTKGNPNEVIYKLIRELINKGIIDKPTAASILVTFRVPVPDDLQGGNPLTTVTINNLPIHGNPDVKIKFIQDLIKYLNRPSTPGLLKLLFELVLNNKVLTFPQILKITIEYGIIPNVEVVIPPEKVTPRPTPRPTPAPTPAPTTTKKPAPTAPNVVIIPGKPNVDCTITITQIISPDDANNLVIYLLELLKPIIDRPTADRIIVTFIPGAPNNNGARPLTPLETIVINGNPKPKDKFLKVFINLLKNPKAPDAVKNLIKILIELLVDNGVTNQETIIKIIVKFGVAATIQVIEPRETPVFPDNKLVPGEPSDNKVTIIRIEEPDFWPSFINRLLQILVNKKIVDLPTANRILVTFNIPGVPGFPFNPSGERPLNENDVIHGNPKPREKFFKNFITLWAQKPQHPEQPLAKILLELLIDNGAIDLQTATNLAVTYTIQIQIQSTPEKQEVVEPSLKPGPRPEKDKQIDSTVTIKQVVGDLKSLIKRLVELAEKANIIPLSVGTNILTTFNVQPGGTPLNPSTVTRVTLGGIPEAAKKFIKHLTPLVANPSSPDSQKFLVKILAELLIDNYVYDYTSIAALLQAYGVGSTIDVQFIIITVKPDGGDPNGPQLLPGKRPPSGTEIHSTVSITQVTKDLKPLIKRLVELNVQANLIPQSVAANLLTTFNVQPGGSPLSGPLVALIKLGGVPEASQKFIKGLTPLVQNPSSPNSQSGLVKILTELLIDNAVYDHNSLLNFLVALGVGAQIRVEFIQTGQSGTEPQLVPGKAPNGMRIQSTVSITQALRDLKPLIKRLVELNVKANLISQSAANSILATFNVQPGGSPLSPATASMLQVGGIPDAAKKFTKGLTPLVGNPSSSSSLSGLVKILTELLIDNAVYDHNSLLQLLVFYGVGAQVQVQYIQFGSTGHGAANYAGTEGFDLNEIFKAQGNKGGFDLNRLKLKQGSSEEGSRKKHGHQQHGHQRGNQLGVNLDFLKLKGSGEKKGRQQGQGLEFLRLKG